MFICHCIVCPSIYGFWFPFWYLQTFHINKRVLWKMLTIQNREIYYRSPSTWVLLGTQKIREWQSGVEESFIIPLSNRIWTSPNRRENLSLFDVLNKEIRLVDKGERSRNTRPNYWQYPHIYVCIFPLM